ncbi:hypothetical protein ABI049_15525, partial [Enterococcus faecium]|uniref:hypothetical protein n=1 Tax=Enterococcus faecium TaxID=1352 RepID=UPI003F428947
VGKPLLKSLGARAIAVDESDPIATAREGRAVTFRVSRFDTVDAHYLDVAIRPVPTPEGAPEQMIAIVRNVTAEVEQQRKLDALHQA